jgi:hypothetical protein
VPLPVAGGDTCVSYEEEDTCVSYEEEDTCVSALLHMVLETCLHLDILATH